MQNRPLGLWPQPVHLYLILRFANCWFHYSSATVIHSSVSLFLFFSSPSIIRLSFHIRDLIYPFSMSLLSLLKYDWAWEWQMNSQSECILSPSSLSAALHLLPQAVHSASPSLYPPVLILSPCTHGKLMGFRVNCAPLGKRHRIT